MSVFWSSWITVLTIVTLVLIVWVLFTTRKMKQKNDSNTTGHVYDGIVEEDNPLPQWWLFMFVITIIFGVGYLVAYPGLGNYEGLLGWTSKKQHDMQVEKINNTFLESMGEFSDATFEELIKNKKAKKMGRRLFSNNCSVCHGSYGQGAKHFPNLADDIWQWGGTQEQVLYSITHGRQAAMPAWQTVLSERDIEILANYLLVEAPIQFVSANKPAGLAVNNSSAIKESYIAKRGFELYQTYCIACHGTEMQGNPLLGGPSLVDQEWLYGASLNDVTTSIELGRNGVMPAHKNILSEEKIRLIMAYVMSLSSTKTAIASPVISE